jgi:hypothetical protein
MYIGIGALMRRNARVFNSGMYTNWILDLKEDKMAWVPKCNMGHYSMAPIKGRIYHKVDGK